ncbi:TRAP transporter substrate-binding protein DctP [Chloroflexota bacterium]
MKRMRFYKLISCLLLMALIAIPLTVGCAPETAPTEPGEPTQQLESFVMKFNSANPAQDAFSIYTLNPWAEYADMVLGDRVTIETYYGGELHGHPDALESLEVGISDASMLIHNLTPGKFPMFEVFSLPGVAGSTPISNMVAREVFDKYPQFEEQYQGKIVPIWSSVHLRSHLHTVEPIPSLKDLEGKVIACHNDEGAKALGILGASTTVMAGSDMYLAAERGVVDGLFCPWALAKSFSLGEVAKYHTLLGFSPVTSTFGVNRDTWDKMTPHEQDLMKQYRFSGMVSVLYNMNLLMGEIVPTVPEENYYPWSNEDMTQVQALFKPMQDEWVEKMEAEGYPGRALLEDVMMYTDAYTNT